MTFVTKSCSTRQFSLRTILAIAVACVFVLQGLAFASPMHLNEMHGGVGLEAAGIQCAAGSQGGDSAPARHEHHQCCILSSLHDHDGLLRFVAIASDIVDFSAAQIVSAIDWGFLNDPDGRPTGWTSSWSSRAPPSFS